MIYANIGTLTLGLILVIACKTAVIVPTGYLFGYSTAKGVELGLLLGPAGEFAFVLLGGAASSGLIGKEHTSLLMSCVALGMATLPALVVLGEKIGFAFKKDESPLDVTGGSEAVGQGGAIVIGSGRVGSLVSFFLISSLFNIFSLIPMLRLSKANVWAASRFIMVMRPIPNFSRNAGSSRPKP